ncbi:MAG: SDR family oxidoreductase [Ruminococcaceae bacterium]|nr:SDR family oxidoreductase [Oscillospiraceae bacterium]
MNQNIWNTDLSGRVVAITGAGGVICSHFARVVAGAGARVALLDRNRERSMAFAQSIREEGGIAEAFVCDVLNKQQCEEVAERVKETLGECDILINGAGGNHPDATTDKEYFDVSDIDSDTKSFFDLTEEGIRGVLDLNFLGTLIPTQAFAKQMIGRVGCSILNISSMNAYSPLTKIPAYSGAKAAISNFTMWLAVYFSKVGIRVNAIAPGFFSTRQNAKLLWNEDGSPTERTQKILQATPMRRLGDCEELDGSLLFLLDCNASSFITGIVLPVDGGFSAYSGV